MNIKQPIILLIFLMFIFEGCTQNEKLIKYKDFEKGILSDPFVKFPIKGNNDVSECMTMSVEFCDTYEYLGYCGISIVYEYEYASFTDAIKFLDANNIGAYNDIDYCLLLINDTLARKCEETNSTYYPIYDFYSSTISANKDIIGKKLKYYIIDCKEGKYLRSYDFEEKPKQLSPQFLSRTYQHGFSNGATVDMQNRRIVYWIVIW